MAQKRRDTALKHEVDPNPFALVLTAEEVDRLIDEGPEEVREALRRLLRSKASNRTRWRHLPSGQRLMVVAAGKRLGLEIDLKTGLTQ